MIARLAFARRIQGLASDAPINCIEYLGYADVDQFVSETAVGAFTLWLFSRGRWKTVKV